MRCRNEWDNESSPGSRFMTSLLRLESRLDCLLMHWLFIYAIRKEINDVSLQDILSSVRNDKRHDSGNRWHHQPSLLSTIRVPNFSLSICPDSIFSGGRNRSSVSIFAKIANKSFACRRAFWIEFLHEQRRCACLTSLANARVVNSYQFLNFHLLSPSRLPWNSQDHLLRWSPRLFVRIFDSLFVNIFQ